MKKQLAIKIISGTIIFIFAMFFLQIISPLQISAATEEYGGYTSKLNWDNPNQKGTNPYQFKTASVLNSDLIMSVVGCTGVVNKISKAILSVVQTKPLTIKTIIYPPKGVPIEVDTDAINKLKEANAIKTADAYREECLNGIAVALAKNQLTAMTKYTMNWIATGFSGDPMYVRDANSFMNSITNKILISEINFFNKAGANLYPFGRSYGYSLVDAYRSANNFYGSMRQTITNTLPSGSTINDFSNNFSLGGWEGWLALTQEPQNNPLGSSMLLSQHLAEEQAQAVTNQKEELAQNNGYLSQKKCVEWKKPDAPYDFVSMGNDGNSNILDQFDSQTLTAEEKIDANCSKWEVVTPGSTIGDKISTAINSPERQLELAKTINDSLNGLFTTLIAKFQNQGLTSLSSNTTDFGILNRGGFGSNSSVDLNFLANTTSGGYSTGSFDLIRDLGNTYIKEEPKYKGEWNASTNEPELYKTGPLGIKEKNIYYTVSVSGNTKLFDGNIGWKEGERAFWDGEKWQKWLNWDKTPPKNPIAKRGVIQIQQDYIVAANEILKSLPAIMPAIGELDYCIPGPNPNWRLNSEAAREAYFNYLDGITVQPVELTSGNKTLDTFNDILGKYMSIVSLGMLNFETWLPDVSIIVAPKKSGTLYNTYKDIFKGSNIYTYFSGEDDPDGTKNTELWYQVKRNPLFFVENGDAPSILEMILASKAEERRVRLENKIDNIGVLVQNMDNEYHKKIRQIYGNASSMQDETLEREDVITTKSNPNYLKMSATGFNITKDILSYAERVDTATTDYNNSIVQANSNIYKLNDIKNKVNIIIQRAQKRRADTFGKTIPPECLEQEEILYIDDTDLLGGSSSAERCSNGIDDDLDGLIDMKDPDCPGYTGGEVNDDTNRGSCSRDTNNNSPTNIEQQREHEPLCSDQTTKTDCEGYMEYDRTPWPGGEQEATVWGCEWIPSTPPDKTCYIPFFTASPTSITSGKSSTLSWGTTDCHTSINISNIGAVSTSGTRTVSPTQTTTYTLTANGTTGGTQTRTATVSVNQPTDTPVITKWKTDMITYINNIKAGLPSNTIVIMTDLAGGVTDGYTYQQNYIDAIREMTTDNRLSGVYYVPTENANASGGVHWSYAGLKYIAGEMVSKLIGIKGAANTAFVITGESNTVGLGSNTEAWKDNPSQLTPKNTVKIFNGSSFETLNIGNNNEGSLGQCTDGTYGCHGFELGLANAPSLSGKNLYIVKTGVSGTKVADWLNNSFGGVPIWTNHINKIATARGIVPQGTQWVVLLSLGINDAKATSDTTGGSN